MHYITLSVLIYNTFINLLLGGQPHEESDRADMVQYEESM